MKNQFPLRQKRKAATRSSLIESARALFAEKGYDDTTLEQIAEHAGLHVQTVYRHFATKQDLATATDSEVLDRFREAITDPKRTNNTFEFWRGWVGAAAIELSADGGEGYRQFLLETWGPPMVSTKLIKIGQEFEDLLAESLAKDFGLEAEEAYRNTSAARLAAVLLWGANSYINRQHATQEGFDLVENVVPVVDAVQEHFGHLVKI